MGKLKILLLSTALAAFGAGVVLAQPVQYAATTGETKAKVKKANKKVAVKKTTKKKALKAKKPAKKKVVASKAKKKPTPSNDTEAAPGNPPPGNSTN